MSDQDNQTSAGKRRWNWLKIGFVLSLAFNVLVIGAVGSVIYKWKSHSSNWRGQITVFSEGRNFVRSLPRERRRELRKIWRKQREARHSAIIPPVANVAATKALITALEADPLTDAQLEQAVSEIYSLMALRFTSMRSVIAKSVRAMTKDERKTFASRLKQALAQKN